MLLLLLCHSQGYPLCSNAPPAAMAGGQGKEHATRHWCPAAHSPASKRLFVQPRSAATDEGCGGTLPPRCPPAHARASSGTRARRRSPGTYRADDRGPPAPRPVWHAIQPSLAARPRGLSCWWAQRGWALTQEPSGITVRSLVRREESRRGVSAGRAGPRTVAGDVPDWRTPKSARRATPGTGRSDTVAYL